MEKIKEKQDQVDVVIVGTGVAGLFAALNLPRDFKIMMITKADLESSDSFLAQGGICVLRDESDYDSYFEDTMRAGHYENRKESVDIMIRSSQEIIRELIGYGVEFERRTEHSDDVIGDSDISRTYEYTREGAHSSPRILFHEDITGKEITGKLLARVKELDNVEIFEYTTMTDIIEEGGVCRGVVMQEQDGTSRAVRSAYTIVASGGIGGLYRHSTNFPHLTGDALEIAKKHGIRLPSSVISAAAVPALPSHFFALNCKSSCPLFYRNFLSFATAFPKLVFSKHCGWPLHPPASLMDAVFPPDG